MESILNLPQYNTVVCGAIYPAVYTLKGMHSPEGDVLSLYHLQIEG
jgi:hypothetical protein